MASQGYHVAVNSYTFRLWLLHNNMCKAESGMGKAIVAMHNGYTILLMYLTFNYVTCTILQPM